MNGTRLVEIATATDHWQTTVTLPDEWKGVETVQVVDPTPVAWEDLEGMGWTTSKVWLTDSRRTKMGNAIILADGGSYTDISLETGYFGRYPDLATALLAADLIAQGQGGWA